MTCHNCGFELPSGTLFCGKCGTKQHPPLEELSDQELDLTVAVNRAPVSAAASAPQEPVFQEAPTFQQAPTFQEAPTFQTPAQPAAQFFTGNAQPKATGSKWVKPLAIAILISMLLSLTVLVFSGLKLKTTNITDMKVVIGLADSVADVDIDDLMDQASDTRKDLQRQYNERVHLLSEADRRANEKMLSELKDIKKHNTIPDLMNFLEYMSKQYSKMDRVEGAEEFVESQDLDMDELEPLMERVDTIKTLVTIVLIAVFALPGIFALLGGLCKSTGLTVVALILTLLVQILFSTGFLLILLGLLAYGLQIALCIMRKKAKKSASMI